MADPTPSMTITFPINPAIPNVEILGLTPFQLLLAAAIVARIANSAMDQLEDTMTQAPTGLVLATRLPEN